MGSNKLDYDATSRLEQPSEGTKPKQRRSSMSSVTVESYATPSFLANLLKEHSITNVSFVPDNAKAPATVPRSVYCQSPKSVREKKSITRWDSIVRRESQDAREGNTWKNRKRISRRRSGEVHSLSPSPLNRVIERWNATPTNDCEPDEDRNEKLNNSAPSLDTRVSSGSSDLPDVLLDNLSEIVVSDDKIRTNQERIRQVQGIFGPLPPPMRKKSDDSASSRKTERRGSLDTERPDPMRQRSSSDPSLRIPRRRASIEPGGESRPLKSRRARRRASMDSVPSRKHRSPTKGSKARESWWNLGGDKNDGDSDGNGTESTQELTPLQSTPQVATVETPTNVNNSIEAPLLNTTPQPQKAMRRSSEPFKMPSSKKKSNRSSRESKKKNKKRPTSPPPPQPGTPPSLKRDHRSRRHSTGIISIDMEVSKKLLHLAQISSPVMPVRQESLQSIVRQESLTSIDGSHRSNKKKTISHAETIAEDRASEDVRNDQGERVLEEARQYMEGKADSTSEKVEDKPMEEVDIEKSPQSHKGHFVPQECSSPRKHSLPNRVSFSPRRMHSEPIAGHDPRNEDDEEAMTSFRRRKPFVPGNSFTQTSVVATKTGDLTRTRTNSARDDGGNRVIVEASLREHSSKGDDDFMFDENDSGSSIDLSIANLLSPDLSLDALPNAKKKKKKNRRSSLPSNLEDAPQKNTKKKSSRRRSLY